MLTSDIRTQIVEAEARALATTGPHGVNVVPVSVLAIEDDIIYLYDFFMGKTVENLQVEPAVALSCWSGLVGLQVKATAQYITDGLIFSDAVAVMKERFPDRTLAGVIALTPHVCFSVSAGEQAGQRLAP